MDKYAVGDIVKLKKPTSVRQQRVGNHACRRRLPPEMHGLRTPGYGAEKAGREK